jgi:hypothetical protein
VGTGVGATVGCGVGVAVGLGVGLGVGVAVGDGLGVGVAVGSDVGSTVGDATGGVTGDGDPAPPARNEARTMLRVKVRTTAPMNAIVGEATAMFERAVDGCRTVMDSSSAIVALATTDIDHGSRATTGRIGTSESPTSCVRRTLCA